LDKEELISKLNWFYSLELNQVDLYNAQSKAFKGRHSGLVFERCAYLEQNHVDNIGEKIKELGSKPSVLGDVLSPIIGKLAGGIIASTGLEDTLMANILIEQKAMKDYNSLIENLHREKWADEELIKILQYNFVDEHLHTEWFRTKLIAIKQYEYSVKHFACYTSTRSNTNEVKQILTDKIASRKRPRAIHPRRASKVGVPQSKGFTGRPSGLRG